jgi:hypothetical protein
MKRPWITNLVRPRLVLSDRQQVKEHKDEGRVKGEVEVEVLIGVEVEVEDSRVVWEVREHEWLHREVEVEDNHMQTCFSRWCWQTVTVVHSVQRIA